MIASLTRFFHTEAAGGLVMVVCAALALVFANSAYAPSYHALLHLPVVGMTLSVFVKDVLMAVFFFAVGMELKREMSEGFLKTTRQRLLPLIAALGGIIAPALIYLHFSSHTLAHGWAIPTATDIAFAIGVLSLLGTRVPAAAKIFLLAIAIYDDLAAILIIAIFYSESIATQPLLLSAAIAAAMFFYNRSNGTCMVVYTLLGVALWHYVHLSGIHPTVAGMFTGLMIPLRTGNAKSHSPLNTLLARIHPFVAFAIMPLFAFTAAGVSLQGIDASALTQPLPLGIAAGLFAGKQIGIFAATFAAVTLGLASLPKGANWGTLLGISAVAGIGFTMSLFIAVLAFDDQAARDAATLGVLAGSLLSALWGAAILRLALR